MALDGICEGFDFEALGCLLLELLPIAELHTRHHNKALALFYGMDISFQTVCDMR